MFLKNKRIVYLRSFTGFLLISFCGHSFAALNQAPVSAARKPNESFKEATERVLNGKYRFNFDKKVFVKEKVWSKGAKKQRSMLDISLSKLVLDSAVALNKVDFNKLNSSFSESENIAKVFEEMRDERFLESKLDPHFFTNGEPLKRRISWLYPDDGCFARAEVMNFWLELNKNVRLKKVFVFGSLAVETPNHPAKRVTWWYHVAPAFIWNDVPYVFDPSIDPNSPLVLIDWIKRMSNDESVTVAICSSNSYNPYTLCENPINATEQAISDLQDNYLHEEWLRLEKLMRDPFQDLGLTPPWLRAAEPMITLLKSFQ